LRLFSFGGYELALAALALVVFGAIECPPSHTCFGYEDKKGEENNILKIQDVHADTPIINQYKNLAKSCL